MIACRIVVLNKKKEKNDQMGERERKGGLFEPVCIIGAGKHGMQAVQHESGAKGPGVVFGDEK